MSELGDKFRKFRDKQIDDQANEITGHSFEWTPAIWTDQPWLKVHIPIPDQSYIESTPSELADFDITLARKVLGRQ